MNMMPTSRVLQRLILGVPVLLMLVLSACGPSTSGGGGGNTPKKGGSITDALIEEPDTLLPFLTNETYSVMVDQALWAPLFYGDPSGALNPGIADVPTVANGGVSSDLKTYTIKLHSGVKWSDGSPLTAQDVAFSYNLYANPKFGNTFGFPTSDPSDPIGFSGATATDSSTVVMKLKNPDVSFVAALADGASGPIPQAKFGSVAPADVAKSSENFQPTVDSGPFVISDRVQGDHITLKPNPNYYQAGKPYLDQVTFKIITDSNTVLTALQSGSVDTTWFADVTKLQSYKALQGYTTTTDQNPAGYEVLVFNECSQVGVKGCVRTSPLQDMAIRQALSMSFNVNDVTTKLYAGTAVPTCDDSAGTLVHESSLTCDQYDPTTAGVCLDQAGWPMGSDGYRHKGGQTLELVYATTNKPVRKQTQLLAQAAWKQVGIKIDLKNYASQDFFGTQAAGILHSGNYDIGEFANTLGYDPDDHTLFQSTETPDVGGSNYMRYSNPAVDQAEQTQQTSGDLSARKAAFHIIHTNVLNDFAVMFLYTAANIAIHRDTLHNYNPSALGPTETWNIWDWYVNSSTSSSAFSAPHTTIPGMIDSLSHPYLPHITCHS
jgi:peptide/nickel transport system substrate-binding protein